MTDKELATATLGAIQGVNVPIGQAAQAVEIIDWLTAIASGDRVFTAPAED